MYRFRHVVISDFNSCLHSAVVNLCGVEILISLAFLICEVQWEGGQLRLISSDSHNLPDDTTVSNFVPSKTFTLYFMCHRPSESFLNIHRQPS